MNKGDAVAAEAIAQQGHEARLASLAAYASR